MRPAIEHAIRTGYLKQALEVPFSLFLENVWDDYLNTVLTVKKAPERADHLIVTLWDIANLNKREILPPRQEVLIHKEELYTSNYMIIDDYRTLEYHHEDYQYEQTPDEDAENWINEEQEEYRDIMDRYFFSLEHQLRREAVLWRSFVSGYMPDSYNYYIGNLGLAAQQCIVREASDSPYAPSVLTGSLWHRWCMWRKHLLDFQSKIAPELAFNLDYEKKIRNNTEYQETVVKEALSRKEIKESPWWNDPTLVAANDYGETYVVSTSESDMIV